MRSFKMKDLMIRIQPEASDNAAYAAKILNEALPAEYHFGTCISPSRTCGTPSTCTSANSCKPTVCPKDNPKPKPKPKYQSDELSGDVMELADLKNRLADMQIKVDNYIYTS
jgi:hypothetical protein